MLIGEARGNPASTAFEPVHVLQAIRLEDQLEFIMQLRGPPHQRIDGVALDRQARQACSHDSQLRKERAIRIADAVIGAGSAAQRQPAPSPCIGKRPSGLEPGEEIAGAGAEARIWSWRCGAGDPASASACQRPGPAPRGGSY